MKQITEKILNEKYDELPSVLRDALNSESNSNAIEEISREHNLNEDDQELVKIYTSYVLLGFLPPKDLFRELVVFYPDTEEKKVVEIVRDINRRVFSAVHKELGDLYQPNRMVTENKGKEIEISINDFSSGAEETVPIISSEKPFIIHQEKSQAPEEKKSSFKGFSMPFGFFKSKNQPAPVGKSTRVEIETSGDSPKNEKRTVNYNELRTSLSPFEVEQNFINPVKNEPVSALIVPIPEIKPVPAAPEIPPLSEEKKNEIFGTIKKPQPKTEGNTIDLR